MFTSSSLSSLPLSSEVLSLSSSSALISPSVSYRPGLRTACPSFEYLPGTTTSIVDRLMLFLRVFSPWVRSCRSVRFGIFSPRPGLSFSCSPRQSTTSRSFDLALFAFLLLSFVACVLHFRRVWFSFQKLQSFHTKRKKHISPAFYEK